MEQFLSFLPIILILIFVIIFLLIASRKGWITFKIRGFFTSQVALYEFLTEEKQRGMDEIIELQAGDKEEDDETGEKPVPGIEKDNE